MCRKKGKQAHNASSKIYAELSRRAGKVEIGDGSPKEIDSRAESRFANGECEHAAALHDAQCS